MDCEPGYTHVRVGVKALIVRGTSILFNETSAKDGGTVYVLPGGGQEHGVGQVEALERECREEVGADVRVYDLAFTYDRVMTTAGPRRDEGHAHHQQNLAFWCDLAPGHEPAIGAGHDTNQVGVRWIDIGELHRYRVSPQAVAQWLQSDPSIRPRTLGTLTDEAYNSSALRPLHCAHD